MSISLRWFERAWFQIKANNKVIYVDSAYFKIYKDKFSENQEKADLILFTHFHGDHCKPSTLAKLVRPDTVVIGPSRCKQKVKENFNPIKPGEETSFGDFKVRAVEAYNIPSEDSGKLWHPKGEGVGYILTIQGETIYHAGDTDFIPEMNAMGKIGVALLPIGDNRFTMNVDEAIEAALAISPRIAIPMHILDENPDIFKEKVESRSHTKVVVLKPGEVFHLKG
jgi:L-ascorbate metabolism protein UlaG (beta-lactamase superfamily)